MVYKHPMREARALGVSDTLALSTIFVTFPRAEYCMNLVCEYCMVKPAITVKYTGSVEK